MKYTIEGFSQKEAAKLQKTIIENGKTKTISLDCTDLVLLRWFVDFFPSMMKVTIDGIQYAWVNYQAILDDMPLLGLGKRSLFDRLKKMSQLGVLNHKTVRSGGTFSYYGFGENYSLLVREHDSDHVQNNADPMKQTSEGYEANFRGGMKQTSEQINPSTTDDSSTKNNPIYAEIVDYLNKKAGTRYKASTVSTRKHIKARLDEGFTIEDFKDVIDKKCAEWLNNSTMEQYLRPETLFGSKFEGYLNAKSKVNIGANGVAIRPPEPDEDDSWFPKVSTSNIKED